MEAVIFTASGVLIYKLWRGAQEGGPLTRAVEVRGIATRPEEPVAAELPDASSTTTPAAQYEAVDSIMRAAVMPDSWTDANKRSIDGAHFKESMENTKVLTWDDAVKSDHSGDTRGILTVMPDHSGDTRGILTVMPDHSMPRVSSKARPIVKSQPDTIAGFLPRADVDRMMAAMAGRMRPPPPPPTPPKKPMTYKERGIAAWKVQEAHRRARLLSQ
jgi:hypothetical protein